MAKFKDNQEQGGNGPYEVDVVFEDGTLFLSVEDESSGWSIEAICQSPEAISEFFASVDRAKKARDDEG